MMSCGMGKYHRQIIAICLPLIFLLIAETGCPILFEWFEEKEFD
jgi:hypothetical protein